MSRFPTLRARDRQHSAASRLPAIQKSARGNDPGDVMSRYLVLLWALVIAPTTIDGQEKPAQVDLAGDPLPPGAVARLGTVRLRHPDWVRSLAASPDGKLLASGGNVHIRLWELPSGRPLKSFPHYKDPANPGFDKAPALAFTAKGELFALGNFSHGSVLYDPATGKKLREFNEYSADVFSADGTVAILVSKDKYALWSMSTGNEVSKVPRLEGFGSRSPATLSADGKVLAISGFTGVRRVDTGTGNDLPAIRTGFHSPDSLALSPDGKRLATAASRPAAAQAYPQDVDSQITVWDADSGKRVCESKTYNRYIIPLAFSGDGKLLAAGLGDMTYVGGRTIVLLDTATGKEVERPVGHEAAVRAAVFVGGTNNVLSACDHDTLRTWDAASGKQLRESKLPKLSTPTFSPDGRMSASTDGRRIRIRDLAADKEVRKLEIEHATDLHFSADAKYLAAWLSDDENEFRLWETATGIELAECRTRGGYKAVAFSPDSKFLARQVSKKQSSYHLQIIELTTGKEIRSIPMLERVGGLVGALAMSPDGKFLAASHHDQAIVLWDVMKGEKLWAAIHPARDRGPMGSVSFACPIAFSPDGKLLVSGGDDHTVRLWEVATGKEVRTLTGHEGTVLAVVFSTDGKWLASASEDTTVLIWDATAK
jgi:WD40 repeat protein